MKKRMRLRAFIFILGCHLLSALVVLSPSHNKEAGGERERERSFPSRLFPSTRGTSGQWPIDWFSIAINSRSKAIGQ